MRIDFSFLSSIMAYVEEKMAKVSMSKTCDQVFYRKIQTQFQGSIFEFIIYLHLYLRSIKFHILVYVLFTGGVGMYS